jgi:hypothetical protein
MTDGNRVRLPGLVWRTIVSHTITYTFMGILAMTFLHYAEEFAKPGMAEWMRQTSDPMVMAGPLFQPIRGLIFALVFYPFREILFGRKTGWLIMTWMLFALGILSTFGPTPGSIEGMVYTLIPLKSQMTGWLEVVPQALLFSVILWYWVRHPEKRWLNWTLAALFGIVVVMITMGLVLGPSAS